jgi:hypothetical protein
MIGQPMDGPHMARLAWLAIVAAAPGTLAACATSLNAGARDSFARTAACAADRVSVVPRPDYKPPSSGEPSAPDDAADPGSLGYWQQRRSSARRMSEAPEADCEMFEATGCGQRRLLCCRHPFARDSSGVLVERTDTVDCQPRSDDGAKGQGAAPPPSAPAPTGS